MISYVQHCSSFGHSIFMLIHCTHRSVDDNSTGMVFCSLHTSMEMWNQKSVCLYLFLHVGEGCYCSGKWESINTPKASFSVSTSNQPSAGRHRASNEPQSRLMGDRVGEGQEVGEALLKESDWSKAAATHKLVAVSDAWLKVVIQ